MTEDKIKIEKFNGTNYAFWKMQMEDILYQKDLYLPIDGKKPDAMKQEEWVILDRKALGTVRLSLAPSVASNIAKEKTTADLFKALEKMYEKPSAVNKVYLMKKLFNLKMSESSVVAEHLNEFNTVTNQLESVGIDFDDEIRALVLLSSLPESWNGLVVAVSNSSGSAKIKLEDVAGLILGEEARRRASGEDVASGSALNTEERGRSTHRGNNKKGRGRSASRNRGRSKSRVKETAEGCWNCGQMGHWKRDCKAPPKKQNWNNQGGKNTVNVSDESDNDALICSMDSRNESWIVDSGASFHATPRMDILQNYVKGNFGRVYLGDDEACNIVGKGDVQITQTDGTVLKLKNVRHVPSLTRNLISVGQLSEGGVVTSFTSEAWKMSKGALILARGKKEGTLYVSSGTYSSIAVSASGIDCTTWHRRLGHMSEKGMKVMLKEGKLPGCKSLDLDFCEDCILGKQKKVSFTKAARTLKTEKLELVHTDVWGPSKVKSVGGSRYFVTFIDDATRKLWVYFLKHKSNVFNVFKNWKALVENETGKKLKCLKSDNGGEYCSSEFEAYCAASGIRRVKTVPKKPRQNGVAERMNRTILERARSMRLHAGLPKQFWADAVNTAAYLINRGPSVPLNCGLPEEAWTGKKVNLSHLRVFGCIAYMHIEAEDRGKLDAKSRKCVFIGYDTDNYGYRLYDFENQKTRRSIDVVFNESAVYRNRDCQPKEAEVKSDFVEFEGIPKKESTEPQDINTESTPQADPQTPPPRRSTRVVKTPMRYSPSLHYLLLTDSGEPECFEEALQVETKEEWEHAMDDEMDSLSSNQTWDLVQLPKGKRALHNKWVYRIKEESDGSKRYKARLVVKGFEQKQGIDYTEIFSPVVKICTIRCVLNIVAVENLHLEQLDVKTAFLHGDLEEDIYMHQPEGYVVKGKENQVCKLRKSLYGLKQAPRQWYKKFDTFMINTGFSRCHGDHCCYFKRLGTSYLILLLYVDDMLVAGSSMDEIANLKAQLSKEFAMKDLGSAKKILGMRISRDRANRKLKLSQEEYVNKVLNRFNMGNAKPVSTPLATHFKLSKEQGAVTDEEKNYMAKVPYASAVGSLMYAMVNTRPDIAYAVGVVSRFMANPGKEHWEAVKWILRYLRGTSDSALCFGGSDISLQGYVDSDLAGDIDSRKSTTGYVFTLGSAAVSWVSRLQKIVTISTTEAEYVAATEACKEMVWLRSFMKELGKDQDNCRLFSDSQSAIHLAKNAAFHSRTKHIDIKYHFIRSLLEDGQFTLEKIHTRDNPADMFTKVVTVEKLKSCSASVGLQA